MQANKPGWRAEQPGNSVQNTHQHTVSTESTRALHCAKQHCAAAPERHNENSNASNAKRTLTAHGVHASRSSHARHACLLRQQDKALPNTATALYTGAAHAQLASKSRTQLVRLTKCVTPNAVVKPPGQIR